MIGVLGDRETAIGFRLAGVKDCIETDEKSVNNDIDKMSGKRIIIINESIFRVLEKQKAGKGTIFVRIPDIAGNEGLDNINNMIKEVIGEMKNDQRKNI